MRRLHAAGASVTILDRNAEPGEALAKELGGSANFAAADVTDYEAVAAAVVQADVHRAAAHRGELRRARHRPAHDQQGRQPHDPRWFRMLIDINLIGTFNVHDARGDRRSPPRSEPSADGERGVIINTASVAAFDGQIGQLAYSASKGAVVGMTLPAARDLSGGRHPRQHHRSRPHGHAAARHAARSRRARRSVPRVLFPKRLGIAGRVRVARDAARARTATERRDDPPRRRHPHATEMKLDRKIVVVALAARVVGAACNTGFDKITERFRDAPR